MQVRSTFLGVTDTNENPIQDSLDSSPQHRAAMAEEAGPPQELDGANEPAHAARRGMSFSPTTSPYRQLMKGPKHVRYTHT